MSTAPTNWPTKEFLEIGDDSVLVLQRHVALHSRVSLLAQDCLASLIGVELEDVAVLV